MKHDFHVNHWVYFYVKIPLIHMSFNLSFPDVWKNISVDVQENLRRSPTLRDSMIHPGSVD